MAKKTKKALASEAPASAEDERQPVREFRKHRTLGEIWAVQWLDDRRVAPSAGRRCSKPHEQTRGALPALPLDDSDETIAWLEENLDQLEEWAPAMAVAELWDAILAAGAAADEAEADYEESAKETKELKAEWEKARDYVHKLLREAREGHERPTLPFDNNPELDKEN